MPEVEGFVLAGGASSRMGENKAHLKLGGKTFVERAALSLSAIKPRRIFLVGNFTNENKAAEIEILLDVFKSDTRASIIGLHTALFHAETEWIAVLACDLPFASGALLKRLTEFVRDEADAVVPLQKDERAQPLCALYRKTCLPKVETALTSNEWRLKKLLEKLETRFVRFEEIGDLPNAENFFFNVNTPADFARAVQIEETL
ncbi:MAG TPA: molybdenum cofactor guanylyltransferase [Pyrinomonadaceae bacterium]|nr:molybdenum cofactor guanylyltransferase [Pyrinomonadaceae bacterium]